MRSQTDRMFKLSRNVWHVPNKSQTSNFKGSHYLLHILLSHWDTDSVLTALKQPCGSWDTDHPFWKHKGCYTRGHCITVWCCLTSSTKETLFQFCLGARWKKVLDKYIFWQDYDANCKFKGSPKSSCPPSHNSFSLKNTRKHCGDTGGNFADQQRHKH